MCSSCPCCSDTAWGQNSGMKKHPKGRGIWAQDPAGALTHGKVVISLTPWKSCHSFKIKKEVVMKHSQPSSWKAGTAIIPRASSWALPNPSASTSHLTLVFYALYLGTTKWFHFNKLYKQALPLAHPHIHIYKRKGNLPFTSQKWHCCYREFLPSEGKRAGKVHSTYKLP